MNINNFEKFLLVQRNLSKATVNNHVRYLDIFLKFVDKDIDKINVKDIQDFMFEIKKTRTLATYKNYLSMLKIFFRDYIGREDLIKDFKFPQQQFKPKTLPSNKDLKTFYDALPSIKYKIIFLALISSGLRISELLSVDIIKEDRMLIPKSHDGKTKKGWISFYNIETENLLKNYQDNPFNTSRNTV
ncbi:MAG TPA: site-specific integrase, partial [archaeon]|nr:site-specific integrase [archaeon]